MRGGLCKGMHTRWWCNKEVYVKGCIRGGGVTKRRCKGMGVKCYKEVYVKGWCKQGGGVRIASLSNILLILVVITQEFSI